MRIDLSAVVRYGMGLEPPGREASRRAFLVEALRWLIVLLGEQRSSSAARRRSDVASPRIMLFDRLAADREQAWQSS